MRRKRLNHGSELVKEAHPPCHGSARCRASDRSPGSPAPAPRQGPDRGKGSESVGPGAISPGRNEFRACDPGASCTSLGEVAARRRLKTGILSKEVAPCRLRIHQNSNSTRRFWNCFLSGPWQSPMAHRFGFENTRRVRSGISRVLQPPATPASCGCPGRPPQPSQPSVTTRALPRRPRR